MPPAALRYTAAVAIALLTTTSAPPPAAAQTSNALPSRTRAVPRAPVAASPPATAPTSGMASVGSGMNGASQRLSDALRQIRMTACASITQRAADFLMEGQEAMFTVQPLGPDADHWPVVITMESKHPSAGRTRLSSIVVNSAGGCVGMYQQVIYWAEPCAVVRAKVFSAFSGDHILLDSVHVGESGPALQVFTMPGGAGCVSVKKELFR